MSKVNLVRSLDCWKTEEEEDGNNSVNLKGVFIGTQTVQEVQEEEKWLGNIFSTDGKKLHRSQKKNKQRQWNNKLNQLSFRKYSL